MLTGILFINLQESTMNLKTIKVKCSATSEMHMIFEA